MPGRVLLWRAVMKSSHGDTASEVARGRLWLEDLGRIAAEVLPAGLVRPTVRLWAAIIDLALLMGGRR